MPSNSIKCKGNLGKIIPVAHLRHAKYSVGHLRPTGVNYLPWSIPQEWRIAPVSISPDMLCFIQIFPLHKCSNDVCSSLGLNELASAGTGSPLIGHPAIQAIFAWVPLSFDKQWGALSCSWRSNPNMPNLILKIFTEGNNIAISKVLIDSKRTSTSVGSMSHDSKDFW
jgi:hypothetical protein